MAKTNDSKRYPLNPICERWLGKLRISKECKQDKFGRWADEALKFYDGAHDWMWKQTYATSDGGFLSKDNNSAMPTFRMTVNRVFEAVALYGPALYHKNPHITVTPVDPPDLPPEVFGIDPQDEMQMQQYQTMMAEDEMASMRRHTYGKLKEHYLNWLQVETDKKTEARRAITEAIITGLGILWTEMYQPKSSQIRYPRSYFVSNKDVFFDPDADYWDDVQWICIRRVHPVNIVEERFGLKPGSIRGSMQSGAAQAEVHGYAVESEEKKEAGQSFDLLEYYEFYSKNGFGDRLLKTDSDLAVRGKYEKFGDYCYLAIACDVPYPLNLPPEIWEKAPDEELFDRVQWEVPYWTADGWPMTRLSFYEKPKDLYPISIIKPAIGELRFVNWCMSFLADKVAQAAGTFVVQAKEAAVEIQKQLQNPMAPFSVLEISSMTGRSVKDVVDFLQAPDFNDSIWKMVSEVLEMIDKRTGLTDLMYGMSDKQIRSATEAENRESNTNIRPDDMATRVEEWLSETAMNEMIAGCWDLEYQDFEPVLGKMGAQVLNQALETMDFERVVRDFDYRVEAGTARKPNKQTKQRALNELGQVILPTLQELVMQGNPAPWNAFISEVADAMDIKVDDFLIPMPDPEQEGPSPEEMEMQMKQAEMEMKQQLAQLDMQMKQQDMELKAMMEQMKLQMDQQSHEQELAQDQQMHEQEMMQKMAEQALMTQEHQLELAMAKKEAEIKRQNMEQEADLKQKNMKAEAQLKKQQAKQKPKADK